jgi:hypothetical protein
MKQQGQAMTEMLVASAFVLVPLFLIVPMLGKYIDMQQATVVAARYSAWEATVKGSSDTTLAQARVYAEANDGLTNTSSAGGRELWTYHNGLPIYKKSQDDNQNAAFDKVISGSDEIHDRTLGITRKVVSTIGSGLEFITGLTDSFLGSGTFDVIDTKGVVSVQSHIETQAQPKFTNLKANSTADLILVSAPKFNARAQVYSVNWGVHGKQELLEKVQPIVPTALIGKGLDKLSFAGFSAQEALSVLTLSPEIAPSQLKFGIIDLDTHPRDKYLVDHQQETRQYPTDNPVLCKPGKGQGYCRE